MNDLWMIFEWNEMWNDHMCFESKQVRLGTADFIEHYFVYTDEAPDVYP